MASQTQTWCDCCQAEDHCNYSQACALEGNQPEAYGNMWPHGYGPLPIQNLIWEHGWAAFTRKCQVEPLVSITDELHVCANCLLDPHFDVQAMRGTIPTPGVRWTPRDERSQRNYQQARKRAEETPC